MDNLPSSKRTNYIWMELFGGRPRPLATTSRDMTEVEAGKNNDATSTSLD